MPDGPAPAASDRVVLITGATGVAGRAAAAAMAAGGARLALSGTDASRLAAVAADLGLEPDRWLPVVADLGEERAAGAALRAAEAWAGRIDVLLHLVGGWSGGIPVVETNQAAVDDMLDQHLWSTLNAVRVVVPGMVERGWGRIVAVIPSSIERPAPKMAAYAIARAAQDALLRTLAREVAASGVTVNLVVVRQIDVHRARVSDPSPKNASWTTPEELADTLAWLCSPAAAALTGARIPLDGRS